MEYHQNRMQDKKKSEQKSKSFGQVTYQQYCMSLKHGGISKSEMQAIEKRKINH